MGEYLGTAARPLGATCRALRALNLHKRYQKLTVGCCDLPNWAQWCHHDIQQVVINVLPCVVIDHVHPTMHKTPLAMAMGTLGQAPKLHTLTLTVMDRCQLGDTGA